MMPVPRGGGYSTPVAEGPNFGRAIGIIGSTIPMLEAPKPRTFDFRDYEGAAWAALGATGARLGAALTDFAGNVQKANDEGYMARAENTLAQRFADHTNKMKTRPPGEWSPTWREQEMPKLMKEFDAMRESMSPTGRAKFDVLLENKLTEYGIRMDSAATDKQLRDNLDELNTKQKRAEMLGDFSTFAQVAAVKHSLGYTNKGQYEEELLNNDRAIQLDGLNKRMAMDPFAAEEMLDDAVTNKGAKLEEYQFLNADTVIGSRDNARRLRIQTQRDAMERLTDEALRKNYTPEQIQEIGDGARLPQQWIDTIKKTERRIEYPDTPEGRAAFSAAQNQLYSALRTWKPQFDGEGELTTQSWAEYITLDTNIRETMPPGYIERFTSLLERNVKQGRDTAANLYSDKNKDIEALLIRQTDNLWANDMLGKRGGLNEETGIPADPAAWEQSEINRLEMYGSIRRMLEENPAITPQQAMEMFRSEVNERFKGMGAEKLEEWQWWNPSTWFGAMVNPMGNNPNVVAAGFVPMMGGNDDYLPPIGGAPQGTLVPQLKNPIAQQIAAEAEATGMDPRIPVLIAYNESNFNPGVKNPRSTARGVFQFLDSDRKHYGGNNIEHGIAKVRDNYEAAKKALGREPSPAEVYVVYYQGIGAGPAILRNPQGSLRGTLNQFGRGHADRVMRANPNLRGMQTNADLIEWANRKMASASSQLGISL